MDTSIVKVLLVGESPRSFAISRRHLENNGCQCHFANSERDVARLLDRQSFDIVLSIRNMRSNTRALGALLAGSRVSLFCALAVEDGCLWLPVLRNGEGCFGNPAMRPGEFANELDEIVGEIRAGAARETKKTMHAAVAA